MELTFECPQCEAIGNLPSVENVAAAECACGWSKALNLPACAGGELSSCPLCVTEDLYVQKDFPHVLGLAIVAFGFIASTIFWFYYLPVWALAVLLLTAAADLVLYYVVRDVTICYRCLSQYRGRGSNPGERFQPFDLAIGERYRQERLRIDELRKREGSAVSSPPVS
jgi:hypothetical protein